MFHAPDWNDVLRSAQAHHRVRAVRVPREYTPSQMANPPTVVVQAIAIGPLLVWQQPAAGLGAPTIMVMDYL